MKTFLIYSFCKINLSLRVIKKLNTGLHEIQSLVTFANLFDIINIKEVVLRLFNASTAFPKKIGTETFAIFAKTKKQIARTNLILKLIFPFGHRYGRRFKSGLKVFIQLQYYYLLEVVA